MKSLILGAFAALTMSGAAQASVIPVLDSITPEGSNFPFNYTGQLAPDQGVRIGSRLVIVDFAGYVPGSALSTLANVTASTAATLPSPLLLMPGFTDDPTIPDLVFTYNGPDFQTSGGPFGSIVNFSGLSALSTLGGMGQGSFSSMAVRNTGAFPGTNVFNEGIVAVPSAVPEPATWAMLMTGFLGLGLMLRKRGKNSAPALNA